MADKGKGGPLRDWEDNSYDEKGRSASGLSDRGFAKHKVSLPDVRDTYDASGSGDPGRSNK